VKQAALADHDRTAIAENCELATGHLIPDHPSMFLFVRTDSDHPDVRLIEFVFGARELAQLVHAKRSPGPR
jgi:hypothetical protein